MLFENQQFDANFKIVANWSNHVFRYCDFHGINSEGDHIDSTFLGCTFEECEWYWGLFNLAVFVQVKFTHCVFRGTAFSGSKFIECEFVGCQFIKDNLNSECSFHDVMWYGCTQSGCGALGKLIGKSK